MSARIRTLEARRAQALKAARGLVDQASADDRPFTDEEQATYDRHMAEASSLKSQIDRERALQLEEAALGAVDIGDARRVEVLNNADADQRRGWKSMGEFAQAVARARQTGVQDSRLRFNVAAPGTAANEAAGADGGFAIPPQFSTDIWRLSLGEGSLLPMTANTETTVNSMAFPKDESTPWGGTGVQAYWQAEATQATATKPVMSMQTMVLHKLMALCPISNELIEDGFSLGTYLEPLLADRVQYKVNEAILFGDGNGKPLGALVSPAAVVQAKDTGQATNTISQTNITNMVTRLLVGELGRAIWVATPDILGPLEAMTVGTFPIYLPNMNMADAPYGMLKGRPLMLSEHASAFSSQGDLNLVSLKGYRTLTKAGGMQTATSMHLYFDADALAFRLTFRMNGAPILSAPVVPPKSTKTRSHFIALGAR